MNGHVSKSAFAKIYGCGPSYVTKLIGEKKLVLSEDGKQVNVEASLRLIEATGDPSKQGVRERWSAYREGRSVEDLPVTSSVAQADDDSRASQPKRESAYHAARTEREQIEARIRQLELQRQLREVAAIGPLVKGMLDTHTAARAGVMQLPDRLAQLVAPETDPQKVHDILRAECERVCDTVAKSLQRLLEVAGTDEHIVLQ